MQAAEAIREIEHALKRPLSAPLSPLSIVNEAGAALVNMHPWRWLERYASDLDYVAGQTYVSLPADCEDLISEPVTTGGTCLQLIGLAEIGQKRLFTGGGRPAFCALSYPSFDGTSAPGRPNLQVWPTPTANEADVLAVFYRAGWVQATADDTWLDVRPFMVPLYKALVRACALGVERRDIEERVAAVRLSSIFHDARAKDGRAQPSYGPIRGGAIETARLRGGGYPGVNPPVGSIVGP
jgi:hypothetical protein